MKYFKKIDLKDINTTKKEIEINYKLGKNYYEKIENKKDIVNKY